MKVDFFSVFKLTSRFIWICSATAERFQDFPGVLDPPIAEGKSSGFITLKICHNSPCDHLTITHGRPNDRRQESLNPTINGGSPVGHRPTIGGRPSGFRQVCVCFKICTTFIILLRFEVYNKFCINFVIKVQNFCASMWA